MKKTSFREDRSGIVWVWVTCLMAIIVYSIVWFSLGMAQSLFITAVTGMYTLPAPFSVTVAFICTMISVNPILMLLGLVVWAYVNSGRREDVTYPI